MNREPEILTEDDTIEVASTEELKRLIEELPEGVMLNILIGGEDDA